MEESNNVLDLADDIDNAGGFYEFLEQGVRNIDRYAVPDDLKEAFDDLYNVYLDFVNEMTTTSKVLTKHWNKYEQDKEY